MTTSFLTTTTTTSSTTSTTTTTSWSLTCNFFKLGFDWLLNKNYFFNQVLG
jgi:hypothetical protein